MAQVWNTVRVFISSTFRDMHAERDYLVRFVFPELRERCAKRRLHLVDVDLRWGVTEEEAEQGKVLEVCLDEIERCRPFFVGLLGERYGWVPPGYDVPDEPQYDWVRQFEAGHSVTALEIYHGVLRNAAMQRRAFFYFRNPAFISDIPEPHRADFLQENDEARARLYRLRSEIRQRCTVRENYGCGYGGVDRDGRVLLTGLEPFGRQVLEDLWSSIDAENPADERTADPLAVERAYHDAFIEVRSQQFIGRQDLLAHLAEYADSEEAMPLIVTGAPGCGKSALLASFAKQYTASHPDTFVLAHFIGVSPGSTDVRRTLLRLCRELSQRFDLGEEILEHYHELRKILPVIIDRSCSQSRIVLILDGLNQLDASYVAHELLWLPRTVPPGLRLIVSTLEGDCLDALRRRVPRARELEVGPLLDDERKEIVTLGLGTYRKQVDAYQMEQLLAKRESASPLYLIVACEELRVFGEFERVTELITNLPDEVEGLLQQVIERFEQDHGRELVESALSLLECSRHGLLESEMLELLRREGEDHLPQAIWSLLYRSLQFYLRPPDETGEGALDFFHGQLSKAVKRRYLESDDRRVAAHRRLARLFASKANTRNDGQWAGNYPRSLSELPYHLLEGRMYEELFQTARDERFLIEQGRAFPDEPDAALRTIQLAIEGASRKDDAAAMAEFVLAHTLRSTRCVRGTSSAPGRSQTCSTPSGARSGTCCWPGSFVKATESKRRRQRLRG
jgi:telomerase protein component 1